MIEKIFDDQINLLKLFIASFIGGSLIILYFFNYYVLIAFKIIGGVLLSVIGLKIITFSKIVMKTSLFYLLNFCLVGVVSSFNVDEWYFLCLSIIFVIFVIILENYKKYHIYINRCQYNISVKFKNYSFKTKGFLDSGNFSTTKDGTPIVFVDKKYYRNLDNYEIIYLNTVGGVTAVKAYKPEKFIVNDGKNTMEKDVKVVFSKLTNVECLLNSMIFI